VLCSDILVCANLISFACREPFEWAREPSAGGACQTRARQPCFVAKFKTNLAYAAVKRKSNRKTNGKTVGSGRLSGEDTRTYVAKIIPRGFLQDFAC